jgi:hypothetical protein
MWVHKEEMPEQVAMLREQLKLMDAVESEWPHTPQGLALGWLMLKMLLE